MAKETFRYFKYEIALGSPIPVPKPKLDVYPDYQNSVQQFLHRTCKQKVGTLGKRDGKWDFGGELFGKARLSSRRDITELLDYAVELGILEPAPAESSASDTGGGEFVAYQLSKAYWDRFDKFQE